MIWILLGGLFLGADQAALLNLTPEALTREPPARRYQFLRELLQVIERVAEMDFPTDADKKTSASFLGKALECFPQEPSVLFWQGDSLDRQNQTGTAVEVWRRALARRTDLPQSDDRVYWARCCQRLGAVALGQYKEDEAVEFARRSITFAPRDVRGYELLLDTSLRTGKLLENLEVLRSAAKTPGEHSPELFFLYLDAMAQAGDWNTLRREMTERMAAAPDEQDVVHFKARLAEGDDQNIQAFALHFLAVYNGSVDTQAWRRSREFLDRMNRANEKQLPVGLRQYVLASSMYDHTFSAAEALTLIQEVKPATPEQELLALYLSAQARNTLAEEEKAFALWKTIVEKWPKFTPGLCGLAEHLEARGKTEEAKQLFDKARDIVPNNYKSRQLARLGATFGLADRGIKVIAMVEHSPLARVGIEVGDTIIQVEDQLLTKLPPRERLRVTRQFQGGEITFFTKDAEPDDKPITQEMDIVLFSF